MYEGLYERLPDAGAYLRRIGLEDMQIKQELACLDRIVHAQLTHVPFDDMDVWSKGACPDLSIAALYDKIVLRRRGGYCFELNSVFNALLRALGFDTYMVAVHIMAGKAEMYPPSHCALICRIGDEKYFCDVGYGGLVPDGGVPCSGESRFGFHIAKNGAYTELINEKNGWVEMRFKDVPIDPVELIPLNYHISQSAEFIFKNQLHLNLRLDDGSVSVVDHEFKLRRGEERVEKRIELDEVPGIMEEYFGIPSDGVALREMGPWKG